MRINGTTIVLTTHYIYEAEQSDCVGLLRSGRLLVEDHPRAILQKYQMERLDNVFIFLCEKSEEFGVLDVTENYESFDEFDDFKGLNDARKSSSFDRLNALIRKEILVLLRQPR